MKENVQFPEIDQNYAGCNALSVDVEDYFQVWAMKDHIDRNRWDSIECRIERNMHRILQLFENTGATATFFWLGWAASRFPDLVRTVVEQGHEIASHGYSHVHVYDQTRDEFREDVSKTKKLLEDISGTGVTGYRAASYSINARNLWALDILAETGHRYSSSIYPIRHDHYGMREAPRFAFQYGDTGLVEIPVTTVEFSGWRIPCGGGGYFRLLPYRFSKYCISRVNKVNRKPAVFYFHPWEIDPAQPRVRDLDFRTRFRHYVNLDRFERKLVCLTEDFRWDAMTNVYADIL